LTKERWPDFFIVGAPRSGTTSLYEYLKSIPEIFLSSDKEPNFFSISTDKKFFAGAIRDKKNYLDLFQNARENQLVGESSPSYLRDSKSAQLIHDVSSNAKIIIILRNPIERAFSHYLLFFNLGTIKNSFSDLINQINNLEDEYSKRIFEAGLYSNQVKKYLNIFGKNHVKILIFEEAFVDFEQTLNDLLRFLGIQRKVTVENKAHGAHSILKFSFLKPLLKNDSLRSVVKKIPDNWRRSIIKNLIKEIPKPPLMENEKKILINYYKVDIKNLEKILGRTIPWNLNL